MATPDGKIIRRYTDQLRNRHASVVQLDIPSEPKIEPNEEAESEVLNPGASMMPEGSSVNYMRRHDRIRNPIK